MTLANFTRRAGQAVAVASLVGAVGMTAASQPAEALGTGAAVGIGLGAFALGAVLANPYNGYYGYPYGYYYPPAPAYYYGPPGYYAPRSCWSPYYNRYYAC